MGEETKIPVPPPEGFQTTYHPARNGLQKGFSCPSHDAAVEGD
jgi:hypothetical protein